MRHFWQVILGFFCSALGMFLLGKMVLDTGDAVDLKDVVSIFKNLPGFLLLVVVLCQLAQGVLRSFRYQMLIHSPGGPNISSRRMLAITFMRNMCVDLLPARTGELVYVWLVKRIGNRELASGLSSLGGAFVLDIFALAVLIPLTMALSGWSSVSSSEMALAGILGVLAVLAYFGFFYLFPRIWGFVAKSLQHSKLNFLDPLFSLVDKVTISISEVRSRGALLRAVALSIGIRFFKYTGMVLMLHTVLSKSFMELDGSHLGQLLIGIVAGEGFASLPIPAFMGFGTYEAGATWTLQALGYSGAAALISIFIVHLSSQLVDYTLGFSSAIIAWTLGWFDPIESAQKPILRRFAVAGCVVAIGASLGTGLGYALSTAKQAEDYKSPAPIEPNATAESSSLPEGFIVWTSNRFGNHEILKKALQGEKITRITHTPEKEFYPSISPDGSKIVFMRSKSADNPPGSFSVEGWDIVIKDLQNGQETLVARDGYHPSWTPGTGNLVYTHRGNSVKMYNLKTGQHTALISGGINGVPTGYHFYTANYLELEKQLLVTIRGTRRTKWRFDFVKPWIDELPGGCQLNWMSDRKSMVYVAEGGNGGNRIVSITADKTETTLLDVEGEFSHEYFPRVSHDGKWLIFGASLGDHAHDSADYEVFLCEIGSPNKAIHRLTFDPNNDAWADLFLYQSSDPTIQ